MKGERSRAASDDDERFTAFDWSITIGAGAGALGLFAFPIMGSAFAGMFRDLGGEEHLPTLSKLAVSLWFPPLLGLLVALAAARGVRAALPLARRRLWVLFAMVLGGVAIGACVIGVYMPMFMLAGNIKP